MAVVYALKQCRMFVMGCPKLVVAVDHKPLTRILNDRPLETIENPVLLRLKEKTLPYNFDIVHIPGKRNCGPDAASRYPTRTAPMMHDDTDALHEELTKCAAAFAESQSASLPDAVTWKEVEDAAITDEECVALKMVIENGFPSRKMNGRCKPPILLAHER